MADTAIPDLTAATTPLAGTEELPAAQGNNDVKITVDMIGGFLLAGMRAKIVEIGTWNMDSTGQVFVAHGLGSNFTKIRAVSAEIINDAGSTTYNLISCFTNAGLSSNVTGAIEGKGSTNITLTRVQSGFFDSTDFDSTLINRGWLTIFYEA